MRLSFATIAIVLTLALLFDADLASSGNQADNVALDSLARILAAEDSLRYEPFLAEISLDPNADEFVRKTAALAIGHIGDLKGIAALLAALKNNQLGGEDVICSALGWLWANSPERAINPELPREVLDALLVYANKDHSTAVRIAAFEALALAFPGEGQELAAQTAHELAAADLDPGTVELFRAIVRVAATPGKMEPRQAVFVLALSSSLPVIVYQAAYFAGRSSARDLSLTPNLVAALDGPDELNHAAVLRAITSRESNAPSGVVERAKNMLAEGTTQEIISAANALAKFLPAAEAFAVLKQALDNADTTRATSVHQAIIEALAKVKDPGVAAYLWNVGRRKVPCWRTARIAAARAGAKAEVLAEPIDRYAEDDELALLYVELLAAAGATEKLNWLVSGEGIPERFARSLIVRQAIVLALVYGEGDEASAAAIQGHESWLTDPDPIIRVAAFASVGADHEHDWLKALREGWRAAKKDRAPDVAVAVLEALESQAQAENARVAYRAVAAEFARQGIADQRLVVRRKAVDLLYKLTRKKHANELFGVDTGRSLADYQVIAKRLIQWPTFTKLIMKTNKGDVTLMASHINAPLAADNFLRLAAAGFYDGLRFHRVVPGFVAQGGDPQGLGWGGPGYAIRDEENMPFTTGTLGMASASSSSRSCRRRTSTATILRSAGSRAGPTPLRWSRA